jgi:hypothetical protein
MATATKLSSTMTVTRYQTLEARGDREGLAEFIRQRFAERYFDPIRSSTKKHGFLMMAVCCLLIETLESFYQGKSEGKGRKTFEAFFSRDTGLREFGKDFGAGQNWFYTLIRCGVLHQSETKGGWRILRKGDLLDASERTINAAKFLTELSKAVDGYAAGLITNDVLWKNFKKKMKTVCENCEI